MFLKVLHGLNLAAMYLFSIASDRRASEYRNLLNQKESLRLLMSSKKSLIRWGDGESTILTGGNIHFQHNSPSLLIRLLKVVRDYKGDSPYLIAMPNKFISCSKSELVNINKYRMWAKTRYVFRFLFPENEIYLDAFVFREDSELSNDQIKLLWNEEDVIIFIHSNYKYYLDFAASVPDKQTHFIPVFSAGSASCCDRVIDEAKKISDKFAKTSMNVCALVSAGPAGKIMVAKMAMMGIRSLDMGHYFDYKFYDLKREKK